MALASAVTDAARFLRLDLARISETASNSPGPEPEPLLPRAIIQGRIDAASRVAICIEVFCTDQAGERRKVGSGTGFIHQRYGRDFLITNWHVVTGRDPDSPGDLLDGYPASPSSLQIYLPTLQSPREFLPIGFVDLYCDGEPHWLETRLEGPAAGRRVDLVALPGVFPSSALITRIEQFSDFENQWLRAGRDVVIVGYPFGIRAENPFPIWKRGFVASEPSILIGGMPKFYIDSPGRPGMSGSPVFMINRGMGVSKKTHDLLKGPPTPGAALAALTAIDADELSNAPEVNMLQFAGIYSGAVRDQDLHRLSVGVAWHAGILDWLFTHPVRGSNPFPPFT